MLYQNAIVLQVRNHHIDIILSIKSSKLTVSVQVDAIFKIAGNLFQYHPMIFQQPQRFGANKNIPIHRDIFYSELIPREDDSNPECFQAIETSSFTTCLSSELKVKIQMDRR